MSTTTPTSNGGGFAPSGTAHTAPVPPGLTPPVSPEPTGKGRWSRAGWIVAALALVIGVGAGAAIGGSQKAPRARTVTEPARTVVQRVPGPTKTTVQTRTVPGPTKTVTQTVQAATPAPSSPGTSSPGTSSGSPGGVQHFSGTNQVNLGTITVPTDSTISWSCPGCGSSNFIINNAASDPNLIPTNGLDQTNGVDPLPAGTYNTVVVDTDGGSWTVTVTPG